MRKPWLAGIIVGIAVGLILPSAVLVYNTHVVCSVGSMLGWSGDLLTPVDIALAPPGGFILPEYEMKTIYDNGNHVAGQGSYGTVLSNASIADFDVINWTLLSVQSSSAPLGGSSGPCPAYQYGYGAGSGGGGCGGCTIAPPVAAGVGHRLNLTEQFTFANLSSALINAAYGATPDATFSWNGSASDVTIGNPSALTALPATAAPYYVNGSMWGLAITVRERSLEEGIPFHLKAGGEINLPLVYPQDNYPGCQCVSELWINNTYVLPLSTDQGTWDVYWAGAGGPFAPPDLLFVQVAPV